MKIKADCIHQNWQERTAGLTRTKQDTIVAFKRVNGGNLGCGKGETVFMYARRCQKANSIIFPRIPCIVGAIPGQSIGNCWLCRLRAALQKAVHLNTGERLAGESI